MPPGKSVKRGSGPTSVVVLVVMASGAVHVKTPPPVVTVVVPDSVIGGPVPIWTTPPLDTIVSPPGSVVVRMFVPPRAVVEEVLLGGNNVKTAPPVEIVVVAVTLGRVMGVLVPICTTPELETTISPPDRVHIVALAWLCVDVVVEIGDSVNVSPSVVRVVSDERVGRVMGALVPICTTPELETTICPSERVQVVTLAWL